METDPGVDTVSFSSPTVLAIGLLVYLCWLIDLGSNLKSSLGCLDLVAPSMRPTLAAPGGTFVSKKEGLVEAGCLFRCFRRLEFPASSWMRPYPFIIIVLSLS